MERIDRSRKIDIPPFWNRIPSFFLYGLKPVPVILSALSGLLLYLAPNFWVSFLLYAVALKYSMEALQHTMRGELAPPPITRGVLLDKYELPLTLFAVLALYLFALYSIGNSLGLTAALLLFLFGAFLFPALIMCLGISESFSFSANPLNWLTLVKRIGWGYLALYGLQISLSGAQTSVEYLVFERVDSETPAAVWMAINTLFMIISFHMMGYVILQYHQALDEPPPAQALSDENIAGSLLLEKFIQEGNSLAATEELIALVKSEPNSLALRKKLHNYAMLNQQKEVVVEYAPAYMQLLLKRGDIASASQLFSDCLAHDNICHPRLPSVYLPIFINLKQRRCFQDAIALAKGFHKRFPANEHTPNLYLELAKVFCEEQQRDDLAKKLLHYLLKTFHGHQKTAEVESYLKLLESLTQEPS
ncbi:MAG: hypothetical protein KZQ76_03865 [Candidatus Thiodiazotropha sp. (ex Epidulcina cf. delphinae)]|nr:hypothetical protein [Candidatus Thiodiazotropha sp. (ex Epidulcina cf. delphinae)]